MADLKSSIAEVKLAYNIVDYIQASGVSLRSSGGSTYKGLCRFHQEKTPSFTVNSHFQNYKCFGCGASGDLIKYVQETEHLEFFDALKKLAEDKNIKLDLKEEKSGIDYSSLRECMRATSNFFFMEFKKLDADHPAKIEVSKRGFAKSKIIHGYAPEARTALYKHLKEKGFSDETILLTGACVQYEGKKDIIDFWRGRLMFFITDVTGKPIGWSGRKLYESDTRGKYVNSKDGVLFDKSASLYHLSQAKKMAATTKKVYVSEGQFDVEALAFAGLENTVAASGTAFTEKQAMILRRLVGEDGRIIFCFDGDEAGRKAAEKVFTSVPLIHSQAFVVTLPENTDPCDYRLEHGNEALVAYVEGRAVPLVEFVLKELQNNYDLDEEVEKTQFVRAAARILKTLTSTVLRESYVKQVSLEAFVSIDLVRDEVEKAEALKTGAFRPVEEVPHVTINDFTEIEPLEGLTVDQLKEKMEVDDRYRTAVRLIALAFQERTLTEKLAKELAHIPEDLQGLTNELLIADVTKPLLSEFFTNVGLAQLFIMNDYFPFIHLMDLTQQETMFTYLAKELRTIREARNEARVRSKIAKVLMGSTDAGPAMLAKAIKKEEEQLQVKNDSENLVGELKSVETFQQ